MYACLQQPKKGSTMNKTELIEQVAKRMDISTREAQRYLDALTTAVGVTLKGGEEVQITGFGKFYRQDRKAREGRNPQTGKKMTIPASKVPAFSAGNALKEAI
jgi:DNA-binding protein HU-beta